MGQKFFLKLTKDLLASLIITYFLLLIPELILPGLVSSHFNPKYLLIFILLLGLIYSKSGGSKLKKPENPKFQAISRNLINIILFIIALMLILSLYKMKIWQIAVVVIISLPLLLTAEKILIKEKEV
jgi:cell division protein FtsW (lipid II flippase)